MKLSQPWYKALFLISACSAATANDSDEPPDTSRWACQWCAWPLGWHGILDFGPGYVSESSLKFADYRGLDKQGGFLSLGGEAHYLDPGGRYFDLYAKELGIDSRRLRLRGGREGSWDYHVNYKELPRYRGYGAQTPFIGTGSEILSLPPNWVPAASTSGMSALDSSLLPISLETRRRTLVAGLRWQQTSRWTWKANAERQEKGGSRPFGAGVFTLNTSHLPAPVDYTTDRVGLAVQYAGRSGSFKAGLSGSWFGNGSKSVSWANPFQPIGETAQLRAALAPDNNAWHLRLGGTWRPAPTIRLSGLAVFGRMEQDDLFLPYSSNPDYSNIDLPRESLDGRIDVSTINLAGKLSVRLARGLDMVFRVRFDERDNRTPVDLWTPVITDLAPRPETPNRPYSFERGRLSGEARYRHGTHFILRGGLGRTDIERNLQAVAETSETTAWGEFDYSPWSIARLRLKLESSDRDASPYQTVHDPGLPENPLLRKFNLNNRKRVRTLAEFILSATDWMDLSLTWYATEDHYRDSPLGLQYSEEQSLGLDASFNLPAGLTAYAFASTERVDAEILSEQSFLLPWQGITRDEFLTIGVGLRGQFSPRLGGGFDLAFSESEGLIQTTTAANENPFPKLGTELRNLKLYMNYQMTDNWHWKLLAEHEDFTSRDWQLDGLGVDGIEAVLGLGLVSPDYEVTVVRLLASYRF
jgi:MtrB/PioB family decaheme-associated outer membrane protein